MGGGTTPHTPALFSFWCSVTCIICLVGPDLRKILFTLVLQNWCPKDLLSLKVSDISFF